MNWNKFNAGKGKILLLNQGLPAGNANIYNFGKIKVSRTSFSVKYTPKKRV